MHPLDLLDEAHEMQGQYVLYGSEYSPFSVKVRSYFRYKNIPHEWRPRTANNQTHFDEKARLPLVPLVISPDATTLQDSTPILEKMEELYPKSSVYPIEIESGFLSALLEEYGDEWVNKPMFHYRWWRDVDQIEVAHGLAKAYLPGAGSPEIDAKAQQIRRRMIDRLSFVGSSEQNREIIENSLDHLLDLLESHLKERPYLFGGRPSMADFGLFCQINGCCQQPTTRPMVEARGNVSRWVLRMMHPKNEGEWEDWETVSKSLLPLLKEQVGALYLPWAVANKKALLSGQTSFTVSLKGCDFTQSSVKYSARSFTALKTRFAKIGKNGPLEDVLLSADCLNYLIAESW